jgi:hypothetical protein
MGPAFLRGTRVAFGITEPSPATPVRATIALLIIAARGGALAAARLRIILLAIAVTAAVATAFVVCRTSRLRTARSNAVATIIVVLVIIASAGLVAARCTAPAIAIRIAEVIVPVTPA